MKHLISLLSLITLLTAGTSFSQQQRYNKVWQTPPWDSGGVAPNSAVWSMYPHELDLDNDGKKEILCTSAWSDSFYNVAYLYENNGDNTYQLVWSYSFYGYSMDYSCITVADLNHNGKKEILCLVDPVDSLYHGFYVFEWDGTDNGFPTIPTTTWNMNLPFAFDEGGAMIAGDFDNDNRDDVAVLFQESYTIPKARVMIFSLDSTSTFTSPVWNVEMNDTTTFAYSGYALAETDLDRDGKNEIVASGWDSTFHFAIYENTGIPNTYTRAANVWNVTAYADFANGGMVEANFDSDATNELYITTAAGNIFVVTNTGDVSSITAANVHTLTQYIDGYGLIGVTTGNADGNNFPNLYVAGSYHENIMDFEYRGGNVATIASYVSTIAFQDDTTDDHTSGSDQGYVRPSKIAVGDFDEDGKGDIVIASSSFARDKPILSVIEYSGASSVRENPTEKEFHLSQNYPNPFNPVTSIGFSLPAISIVSLKIFDIDGREVATLFNNKILEAGMHTAEFDGSSLSSGIYFYRLTAGNFNQTKKLILMK